MVIVSNMVNTLTRDRIVARELLHYHCNKQLMTSSQVQTTAEITEMLYIFLIQSMNANLNNLDCPFVI